ncbi:YdcH family protein [Novosphingobium sp. M1R2S20]|uniref:YdcH family protein n=1 Tax=Novosphingobium rhizovicinum TaxID=3228928 RepID=A0ABV3R8E7_9SPHN
METSHVSALQLKHAGIERQIHEEMSRPMPDEVLVQALKKRKLRIKEEIARH